ncbi:hypothetical protein P2W50_31125 [Pseudomonas protegens]|uniref:hypothetical protein n=1 Tax=Pseudomonas protegens TaxID=380021 RepID=UPI0023EE0B62|nr:hypothetical protein [Pseudomonas protegens]MDF4211105.1 hypothetical protein [Pseudomonas protegens]
MTSAAKGAAIYISATNLEGLSQARGLLSMLLESANTISDEMSAALGAIDSVTAKAQNKQCADRRRQVVRRALKVANSRDEN